jgi:hypothetical protein
MLVSRIIPQSSCGRKYLRQRDAWLFAGPVIGGGSGRNLKR